MDINYTRPVNDSKGGDIKDSDPILTQDDSDLLNFYKDSTIFITGATGFLGKLAMEKLLRTCNVKKIYILVRSKKGKDPQKRFEELFDEPSFDPLKIENPQSLRKVHIINGDVSLPNLGLSEESIELIKSEVDVVLHFAATTRFNEKLRVATYINVRAARDLLRIAKHMKKLRSFIHVSTAYSNCVNLKIEEKFYDPPITADKIITLVDCLDDTKLDAITNSLLGDWPNTYTFTKAIAEEALKTEGKSLPAGLYRPSIVIATAKEPVAGWINSIYGITGVLLGVAVGLLRVLHGNENLKADMIPADYVVNSTLAAAWDVATIKTLNNTKEIQDKDSREEKIDKEIPVYNYVSTPELPMTWKFCQDLASKHSKQIPSDKCIWYCSYRMVQSRLVYVILLFLLHTVPAYIVDFLAVCIGKKPMLVEGYKKIHKFGNIFSYFCQREWIFINNNTQSLYNRMKIQDKDLFEFSMARLNWDLYFYTYVRGIRVYLAKDTLDTIPQGRVKVRKLFIAHYTILTVVSLLFLYLSYIIFKCVSYIF